MFQLLVSVWKLSYFPSIFEQVQAYKTDDSEYLLIFSFLNILWLN